MSCRECRDRIAPLIMNELSAEQAAIVEQHAAECVHCAAILADERELQSALADRLSIPDPSPDFETRIMAAARSGDSMRGGWSTPIVGGAIAAALALGIALGVGLKPGDEPPRVDMATTTATPGQATPESTVYEPVVQTVRLAFSSGKPLQDVTLTLELPANVELASFPGRHQLSWQVDLEQGENVLALPLRVLFPGAGDLVAHIDDGQRQKTFRAVIPGQAETEKMEPAS